MGKVTHGSAPSSVSPFYEKKKKLKITCTEGLMGQERSAFFQLILTIGLRTIIIQFRDEESEAPRVGDLDQVIHMTGRWQAEF